MTTLITSVIPILVHSSQGYGHRPLDYGTMKILFCSFLVMTLFAGIYIAISIVQYYIAKRDGLLFDHEFSYYIEPDSGAGFVLYLNLWIVCVVWGLAALVSLGYLLSKLIF